MKNNKINIKPFAFVMNNLILLFLIVMFTFFRSYLCLCMLILWVLAELLSVVVLKKVVSFAEFQISMDPGVIGRNEAVCVKLIVKNKWFLGLLDCRWHLRIGNRMTEAREHLTVEVPVPFKGEFVMQLPLKCEDLGEMYVEVHRIVFQDFLGMCKIPVKQELSCYCTVLPQIESAREGENFYIPNGSEVHQPREFKGNESDYSGQVRQYKEGDLLRDIHWKLTAKQQELMVKERTSTAGEEIVILQQFSEDKIQNESFVTSGFSMVHTLLQKNLPVRLLAWNRKLEKMEEYECNNVLQVEEVYGQLFHLPAKQRICEKHEIELMKESMDGLFVLDGR